MKSRIIIEGVGTLFAWVSPLYITCEFLMLRNNYVTISYVLYNLDTISPLQNKHYMLGGENELMYNILYINSLFITKTIGESTSFF